MDDRPLRILQVSTLESRGGAAVVARNLHGAYRAMGLDSRMAVGVKSSDDPTVFTIPNDAARNGYTRYLLNWEQRLRPSNGNRTLPVRLRRFLRVAAEPRRHWDRRRGIEDLHYPGTWQLLTLTGARPDVVHCHNLHGGYFDLRALPWLSRQMPVVLTLHDAWLLSGHCAHSLDCQRWESGCGHCPNLGLYPSIRRDATAQNWKRKRDIFVNSRLYVTTPCQWLMDKVKQSVLASAIAEARVIHNGVNLNIFCPADKQRVRAELGIPPDTRVLLFAAAGIRHNCWKDYETLKTAVGILSERLDGQQVLFLAVGEDGPPERVGRAVVQFIPYQGSLGSLARYYTVSDAYIHAAKAETFPSVIAEAMACGVPAVATAVGGIPELVDNGRTGWLVPPGDAPAMAEAVARLLSDEPLRFRLACNAARDARERFDLTKQAAAYLGWYRQAILEHARRGASDGC